MSFPQHPYLRDIYNEIISNVNALTRNFKANFFVLFGFIKKGIFITKIKIIDENAANNLTSTNVYNSAKRASKQR